MGNYYTSNSAALELPSNTYKVYCVLAKYANYRTRECFVSKKTIAAEAKVSLSTVLRSLKVLCEQNLISVVSRFRENGRQTSNLYKLLDNPQISTKEAPKPDKKVRGFSSSTKALTASISATAHKIYDYFQLRTGVQQSFRESKRTIAAQCDISVSTVSRALRELQNAGLITIHSQSRKDDNGASENLYRIPSASKRQRTPKWKILLMLFFSVPMSTVTPPAVCNEEENKPTDPPYIRNDIPHHAPKRTLQKNFPMCFQAVKEKLSKAITFFRKIKPVYAAHPLCHPLFDTLPYVNHDTGKKDPQKEIDSERKNR